MSGTLSVCLGDRRVGELTNIAGDYNIFAFDEAYRDDPARPVLSQSLLNEMGEPLRFVPRRHTIAPPFFGNLLPEPDTLLRHLLARQHGIKVAPDFPLLRALGDDLPGAVRLVEDDAVPEPVAEPETSMEQPAVALRFSLAGAQLKFSAGMRGDRLTIPIEGGTWIVKLPTNTFGRLPENEYAMMRFAAAVGLNVPRVELVDLDSIDNLPSGLPALRADEPRLAYAIERFDRGPHGARLHCEDFNQVAGQLPADKYENKPTEYVAEVLTELCPWEDVAEFVARVVFGVAIGNNDMHLKNWAITYPAIDQVRLAPLYDFVCTRLYYPDSDVLHLSIGGEKTFSRISLQTVERFADRAELSVKSVIRTVRDTVERIRDTWPSFKDSVVDRDLTTAVDRNIAVVPLLSLR